MVAPRLNHRQRSPHTGHGSSQMFKWPWSSKHTKRAHTVPVTHGEETHSKWMVCPFYSVMLMRIVGRFLFVLVLMALTTGLFWKRVLGGWRRKAGRLGSARRQVVEVHFLLGEHWSSLCRFGLVCLFLGRQRKKKMAAVQGKTQTSLPVYSSGLKTSVQKRWWQVPAQKATELYTHKPEARAPCQRQSGQDSCPWAERAQGREVLGRLVSRLGGHA